MNRTIDDPCAKQLDQLESNKKLKYITTNHKDLVDAKSKVNFFGMTVKDQLFVPAAGMDKDSSLRYSKLTNPNVKYSLDAFPVNVGYRGQLHRGDVETEMSLRSLWNRDLKSCQPREVQYYNRSFAIFPKKVETPNATKSVESWRRGGECTRCDVYKNQTPKYGSNN
jgi:hypothetical protein